jgi:hypothetical protein
MENTLVPNPPEAVTGVKAVAAVFCVSVVDGIACVVSRAGRASTVNWKDLLLVCAGELWSVTVTVKLVAVKVPLGVPVISPLAVLKDKPVGRLGLIPKLSVPVPPVAVTGVNASACMLCVSVLDAIASVVTIGLGSTVNWKVLLLTWLGLLESATVIV